jgi:ribosome-associated translation inhibitor RaiA
VEDLTVMQDEINHLRTLAESNTDERVIAAIDLMIQELERRISLAENP